MNFQTQNISEIPIAIKNLKLSADKIWNRKQKLFNDRMILSKCLMTGLKCNWISCCIIRHRKI